MNTIHTNINLASFFVTSRMKKYGWYGMAFFFLKGMVWLLSPLMYYVAIN